MKKKQYAATVDVSGKFIVTVDAIDRNEADDKIQAFIEGEDLVLVSQGETLRIRKA